jgi:RNA recognition motif-containing protein
MGRRLYVGNLPYKATDEDLMTLFSTVGSVASARVMRDMATGRARGFGFVEMTTDEAAQKAIEQLHQHEMEGRAIVVNEAQPKPAGGGGRGFGGGGGGGGRGFGGGNRGGGGGDDYSGGGGGGRREPRW